MNRYCSLFIVAFILASCSSSDDEPIKKMQEMPIVISLPAEQFVNPNDFEASAGEDTDARSFSFNETRANNLPGDPGTYEKFSLPTHLYIFLCVDESSTQKVFTYSHLKVSTSDWKKTTYGSDSIYQYNGSIPFDIPAERKAIKVYAAAWNSELTLKNGSITISSSSDINSEDEIKSVTFDIDSKDFDNLQNLYSSPSNYEVDGKYYGTMNDPESAQPNIDLMLYHVASKLDLMWNVDEDKQNIAKVGEVSAIKMKTQDCLLFKPTENIYSETNDTGSSTYTTDIGTQWLGRKSFYVIPYKNGSDYQVSFSMKSTSSTASGATRDVTITPISSIFTPWIRGFITVAGSNF